MLELGGLFLSALLSATILPGSSEAVLIAVLALDLAAPLVAVGVATAGNTIGSLVNWGMGRFFSHWQDHPRWPVSREKMDKYSAWFRKYGVWSLFLSWVPLIGDALTLVAGLLRVPAIVVAVIVAIAKGLRYLVVAAATTALV